jgi:hypothetical protein
MEAGSDDNEGSRHTDTRPIRRPREPDLPPMPPVYTDDDNETAESGPMGSQPVRISLRYSHPWKESWKYDSRAEWDILFQANISDYTEGVLFGGFKTGTPEEGGSLDADIKYSLFFLKAGIEVRFMPFGTMEYLCPYLMIGGGPYVQFWEFSNAFTSGNDVITNDSLTGAFLNAGIGIYPYQNDFVRVGMGLVAETWMPAQITNQGFDNDYYPITGNLKFVFEVSPIRIH